ncbi:hypothetical protein BAE44_0019235 [Dichanthelium oligosanthes]|uniref:DUF868 domain-containing protein n=1 Tax=Dichanthelium oligosanthes TaxID=888268 RepID=A0A1E5V3K9_9POAL|nr:hypothetical protein BAE44_0019235 [Dichanthelium oligosanthes]
MKDLVSCFSEHAVRISDVACSGAANAAAGAPEPGGGGGGGGGRAAAVSAVTTVYRSRLSASGKELLVEVTWSRAPDGPALSVAVHEAAAASRHRGGAAPRHLHRKKGSGTFTAGSCVVGVFWDYGAARYNSAGAGAGPEPASGFYVAVVADAEFVLLLGDLSRGYVERLHGGIPIAGSRVARRRERHVGCGCWSTKARFLEAGAEHEISVVLLDGDAEAWVTVDGRKVVQLRRLRWNFRGSQTIFLDGGAPVDMTWDLHGWLFHAGVEPPPHASSSSSSCAVFTFQARGASETRLWTEDDDADAGEEQEQPTAPWSGRRQKPGGGGASGQGFCLLIQGFRGFSKGT